MFGSTAEVESMLGLVIIDVVVVGCDVISEIIVLFVALGSALTEPIVNDTAKSSIKTFNMLNSCFPMYSPQFYSH
jgi:hypothetical protein